MILGLKNIFCTFIMFGSSWAWAQVIVPGTATIVDLDSETAKKFAVIRVEGNIAPPIASEFKAALETFPTGKRVIIDFNSPGGMNSEGYEIIATIKKARETLIVDTYIDNGALCASMCIPLFMQGEKRIAGERSTFMFHGAKPWYTNVPDIVATKEYTDVLVASGASPDWIQKLWDQGIFSEPAEYWASGEDLFVENTGVVTKLKSKVQKFSPWSAPVSPMIKPR